LRGVSRIIGVGLVPERLQRVASRGVDVFDFSTFDDQADLVAAIRDETNGRGPDSVIDAVGMEAHGSSGAAFAQKLTGMLPDGVAERLMKTAGIDRLAAFQLAVELVRRGGTISPSGVYGGMADPPPMLVMFDKLMHLRMGQVNVRRWTHLILPLLVDADPLGVDSFVTHHLTLEAAPDAYSSFQKKQDGMIKVMFQP
jgi:threonine dehydrogenase-like Zn-dependent dehydrogenase